MARKRSATVKAAKAAATGVSRGTGTLPERMQRHNQRAVTFASGKDKASRRRNGKDELRLQLRRGEW